MTDDLCEVIITAPDADWLAAFTRRLVEARVAASGHNITPMRSIYRWRDEIHDHAEARVALHTRRSLLDRITAETTQQHPYEVPCVIAVPIIDGNPAYLQWIRDMTNEPSET
jgi:periplasmic divalent cation tolerance protein